MQFYLTLLEFSNDNELFIFSFVTVTIIVLFLFCDCCFDEIGFCRTCPIEPGWCTFRFSLVALHSSFEGGPSGLDSQRHGQACARGESGSPLPHRSTRT